jgi:spore germination cell wall hydrolase CwlJ-like protein
MGRSRLGWACNAIAPWCLAGGLVVSITAQAGQDPSHGASVAFESAQAPIRQALLAANFHLPGGVAAFGAPSLIQASLTLGSPEDLAEVDDEIDPRGDLKQPRRAFPVVDRSLKGDPFLALRPSFNARLNHRLAKGDAAPINPGELSSDSDAGNSALAYVDMPPVDQAAPWSDPGADQKPLTVSDGATPAVPLDVALNSSTPQPSDDKPIVVAAAAPEAPGDSIEVAKSLPNGQPDYASLIDPKDSARQQRCLAEAVYFEARSEPEEGQAAVAQVVLNRVRSGLYPSNVCAVVYQDRNRPFACQFSFACEGKSLRIEEPGPWATAVRIAKDVTSGKIYNAKVGSALNYHANYVMPYWASTLKRVDRIGHHIFYQLRVSQN